MREATPSFTLVKVVAVGILPVPHQNLEKKKPGLKATKYLKCHRPLKQVSDPSYFGAHNYDRLGV